MGELSSGRPLSSRLDLPRHENVRSKLSRKWRDPVAERRLFDAPLNLHAKDLRFHDAAWRLPLCPLQSGASTPDPEPGEAMKNTKKDAPKPFGLAFLTEVPASELAKVNGGKHHHKKPPVMHTMAISMPTVVGGQADNF
jgi:hypothetical protein